jgi:cell division protein FtsX
VRYGQEGRGAARCDAGVSDDHQRTGQGCALELANRLVGQIGIAIRAAALVALVASVLVLAGALAAGNRSRIHDAVVLKTLGATRATLIRAYVYEYGLLGLATAVFRARLWRRGLLVRGQPHHDAAVGIHARHRAADAGGRAVF